MQIGIFAKTFQHESPGECIQAVKAHGMTRAHYNMACSGLPAMPDEIPADAIEAVNNAVARHDVELVGVSGTFNMIHPDATQVTEGLRRLRVLAEAAQAMNIPVITLCTGTRDPIDKWRAHPGNDVPEAWSDLCASMEKALSIAEEFDITLGIEPELANVINSTSKAARFLKEMDSPRLRIIFDPANLFEIASPEEQHRLINEGLDQLADHLIMAHAKDRTPAGTFCPAGHGVLDYPHYLQSLQSHDFTGPLILHGLEETDVEGCVKYLNHALRS